MTDHSIHGSNTLQTFHFSAKRHTEDYSDQPGKCRNGTVSFLIPSLLPDTMVPALTMCLFF